LYFYTSLLKTCKPNYAPSFKKLSKNFSIEYGKITGSPIKYASLSKGFSESNCLRSASVGDFSSVCSAVGVFVV
jgi:hypothetical protein